MEDLHDRILSSINRHRGIPRTPAIHHYRVNPHPDREVSTYLQQRGQDMFRSRVRSRDRGVPPEEDNPALPRDSGIPPEHETSDDSDASNDSSTQSVIMPNNPPPAGAGVSLNANQLAVLSEVSGKDSEDIENFCLQVKRCKEAFGWSQHATSQMVQTKLTVAASMWLRSHTKMAPHDDSLDEWEVWNSLDLVPGKGLKHFLWLRFQEGMNEKGAIAAIADFNQSAHKSVDAFYDHVILAMDRKNF